MTDFIFQTLLDLGASTNYKDSRGLTPLYYSVLYGKNANCTEMLLHERAQIGVQDEQGWYEIHQVNPIFFTIFVEISTPYHNYSKCFDTLSLYDIFPKI